MATTRVRKGQGSVQLSREEFTRRFRERFYDPLFEGLHQEIGRIIVAIVVHGDATGAETLRRSLTDWLTDMRLVPAAANATIDRYVGYYEPYATSHDALDRDTSLHAEVRNTARTLVNAVALSRKGAFPQPDRGIDDPRPK